MRRNKLRDIKDLVLTNHTKQGECWVYNGFKDKDGYPNIKFRGRTCRLSRLVYLIFNGRFDTQKIVCHTCDNPGCINPNHLWLGTHAENAQDRDRKGRNWTRPKNMSGCAIEGCLGVYRSKGLCYRHYMQHLRKRYG